MAPMQLSYFVLFLVVHISWALCLPTVSSYASVPIPSEAPSTSTANLSVVLTLSCYPALDFKKPSELPADNSKWWCDPSEEYAFLGFSYEVTACQSLGQLRAEFKDIRTRFSGRYVRLYGACDKKGFYDNVVTAYENTLGVHALVWFGFNGDDIWKTRRDSLLSTLTSNPKAPFVTRVVQFGSEPLFDNVLTPKQLTQEVKNTQAKLKKFRIPVTVSELAYGYQERGGAQDVLDAIDSINIHMLPFFSQRASTGDQAWSLIMKDLNWFITHGGEKKMYLDENGWPSITSQGVQPNSRLAIANIQNEQAYYTLLDRHCQDLKTATPSGVGWFAHVYSDDQEPGYGIYDARGNLKFPFHPKTHC